MVNIILFSGDITDKICEKFEKWSLERKLIRAALKLIEYINDGLNSMLKIKATIVRGNCFI